MGNVSHLEASLRHNLSQTDVPIGIVAILSSEHYALSRGGLNTPDTQRLVPQKSHLGVLQPRWASMIVAMDRTRIWRGPSVGNIINTGFHNT